MNESVETFLGLAARYLEFANIESLQLEVLAMKPKYEGITCSEEYFQIHQERNKARAAMLPVGRKLAAELEAEGHDSTELLMFLHAADAGGGPPAAFPLWPSLKVQLQRVLLQKPAPPTGESNRTPDSKPDSQKISCPKSPVLLAFIHKLKRDVVPGVRMVDVARDFADGDEKKAENLVRGANRYKHLWKTGQTGH